MTDASVNPLFTSTLSGELFAFNATGGYVMDQSFSAILLQPQTDASYIDVTNAIQVKFDVRTFNEKIGVIKDADNKYVISSAYEATSDLFPNDSITLSAAEFVAGMNSEQVITTGTYGTLYSDFKNYVKQYFNYAGGFTSLFIGAEDFSYNDDLFDGDAFINLIDPSNTDTLKTTIADLTGTITISDINKTLRYVIDRNVFNNRDPSGIVDISSSDPSDNNNYGMAAGFLENDLVWVPAGTTITLKLGIQAENFANSVNNTNNVGNINVSGVGNTTTGLFTSISTASTTNITRTLTAPLLIKLSNLSTA